MTTLEQIVMKTRAAAVGGFNALSIGEALAAALVLNRADWLAELGYTIPQAIDRIGPDWVALIPSAAKHIAQVDAALAVAARTAYEEAALADLAGSVADEEVDVIASLVTYGSAPGYRDASFVFDVQRPGASKKCRLCFRVNAEDGEAMASHILDIHRFAWSGEGPIDIKPGETRPRWIG